MSDAGEAEQELELRACSATVSLSVWQVPPTVTGRNVPCASLEENSAAPSWFSQASQNR